MPDEQSAPAGIVDERTWRAGRLHQACVGADYATLHAMCADDPLVCAEARDYRDPATGASLLHIVAATVVDSGGTAKTAQMMIDLLVDTVGIDVDCAIGTLQATRTYNPS